MSKQQTRATRTTRQVQVTQPEEIPVSSRTAAVHVYEAIFPDPVSSYAQVFKQSILSAGASIQDRQLNTQVLADALTYSLLDGESQFWSCTPRADFAFISIAASETVCCSMTLGIHTLTEQIPQLKASLHVLDMPSQVTAHPCRTKNDCLMSSCSCSARRCRIVPSRAQGDPSFCKCPSL